ncbi:MAG: CehA/McbA family metallohydrolase [Chloroflexota bacterium]
MAYHERVGNLHLHTTASDGTIAADELARLAAEAGLDWILITDHNAYEPQHQAWHGRTLVLVGEELHNPLRPHVNHLLALGVGEDLLPYVGDPQTLVDAARARGGLTFLAHPYERSGALSGEPVINWADWQVRGYTGIELWNYMSEFKSHMQGLPMALAAILWPALAMRGPYRETLSRWDELLAERPVVAVGGTDAHGTLYHLGPVRKRILGYPHLLRALNTHLLVEEPWSGEAARDAQLVYGALAAGQAFVGYDGLAPTHGFTFVAEQSGETANMGGALTLRRRARLVARAPGRARLRLLLNGHCVAEADSAELSFDARAPGVYRVEALRRYALRWRGWIYSNPIYLGPPAQAARGGDKR